MDFGNPRFRTRERVCFRTDSVSRPVEEAREVGEGWVAGGSKRERVGGRDVIDEVSLL